MRKIAEIRQDLSAAIESVKDIDRSNVKAMEEASEKIKSLTIELNLANEAEERLEAVAQKRRAAGGTFPVLPAFFVARQQESV